MGELKVKSFILWVLTPFKSNLTPCVTVCRKESLNLKETGGFFSTHYTRLVRSDHQSAAESGSARRRPTHSLSLSLSDSSVQAQSGRLLCQLWQCSLPASTLWIGVNRLWRRRRPVRPDWYNGISVCMCACLCRELITKHSFISKSHLGATVHYRGTDMLCAMTSTAYFHSHLRKVLHTRAGRSASACQKASVEVLVHCCASFLIYRGEVLTWVFRWLNENEMLLLSYQGDKKLNKVVLKSK